MAEEDLYRRLQELQSQYLTAKTESGVSTFLFLYF